MITADKTANAVVLVQRDDAGAVTIRDASGKVRRCKTAQDYVQALSAILNDPSLPSVEDLPPGQLQVEEAVAEYARGLAPAPLRPLVTIGLQRLRSVLQKASDVRRPPRRTKDRRPRHKPRKGKAA